MKSLKKNLKLLSLSSLIAGSLIGVSANSASAMIFTFTDFSSWQSAVGSSTSESFDTDLTFSSGTPQGFNGFSVTPTFNSPGESVEVSGGQLTWNGDAAASAPVITFNFGSSVGSFAFNWDDVDVDSSYQLTVGTDTFVNPPFAIGSGSGFFGVASTEPFSTATLEVVHSNATTIESNFSIDNVGTAAAVPFEFSPTVGFLVIGGLIGANRLRKKSNNSIILNDGDK